MIAIAPQQDNRVALSADTMRPKTELLFDAEIGPPTKHRGHNVLILLFIKCAGAVDESAAGPDQAERGRQDLPLTPGRSRHPGHGPFQSRLRLPPEQPFAGARRIDDHPVEGWSDISQAGGIGIRDHRPGGAPPLKILPERLDPPRMNLVRHQ